MGGAGSSRLWIPFLVALWLLTLLRPTLSNGDAACYLSQLLEADLSIRTVHLGYLLSALPVVKMLPLEPAIGLNLLSVVWGLLALGALWRLERQVSPGHRPGLAALWLLACPPVLEAFTTAEAYPAQGALLLWALAVWGEGRPVAAGLLWWGALAVSPTSVAALPAFAWRAAPPRQWARLVIAGLVPMALTVALVAGDWLWGPRGLLHAPPGMAHSEALFRRLSSLPAALGWGAFLVGPGVVAALGRSWPAGRRLLAATLVQAVVVWLLVDRYRDVPAQGLTLALLTLVVAEGSHRTAAALLEGAGPRLAWGLLGVMLGWQLLAADQAVRATRRKERAFAELARRVHATMPVEGRVVGSFLERRLYEWYAVGRTPVEGLTLEPGPGSRTGGGLCRSLRPPEPAWLPDGATVSLEPDGAWTWRLPGGPAR